MARQVRREIVISVHDPNVTAADIQSIDINDLVQIYALMHVELHHRGHFS
jgi:hypothetical protein